MSPLSDRILDARRSIRETNLCLGKIMKAFASWSCLFFSKGVGQGSSSAQGLFLDDLDPPLAGLNST